MANNADRNLDLCSAFYSYTEANTFFRNFEEISDNVDPTIKVLALEGMNRIENEVMSGQLPFTSSHDRTHVVLQNLYDNFNQAPLENPPQQLEHPEIDLLGIFRSDDRRNTMLKCLVKASRSDPLIGVLALQGLHCIENDVNRPGGLRLDDCRFTEQFRDILVEWRRNMQSDYEIYRINNDRRPNKEILRALTIFSVLEVPLFIDDYGKKVPLANDMKTVALNINGDTPICHVTHAQEADQIMEDRIQSSNNKNSIKGVWFAIQNNSSVYGSRSFGTTLNKLGVTGLRQGEIVKCPDKVNVILYATDNYGSGFDNLVRPSDEAVANFVPAGHRCDNADVAVSIFVQERFMNAYDAGNADQQNVEH